MHSSVFALNPRRAADVITAYLHGRTGTRPGEVMDIDEDLARAGRLSAELHGYLQVPDQPRLVQGPKSPSRRSGEASGIARRVVEEMDPETCYILGPGTTIRAITDAMGVDKTLLGVDAVYRGRLVGRDLAEYQLLELANTYPCKVVVAAVGGQGYVLGRGNQQISPEVIGKVGTANIMILATTEKLAALTGPLRVDTGDAECDRSLTGYRRVITGPDQDSVVRVEA
jgi:predicted polyphosphate/ATP-dependent NAD kinase